MENILLVLLLTFSHHCGVKSVNPTGASHFIFIFKAERMKSPVFHFLVGSLLKKGYFNLNPQFLKKH
jgi:hypothetical protein